MKYLIHFLGICLLVLLLFCSTANTPDDDASFYTVYERYSYRGPGADADTTFYFFLTSKSTFDSLFFFIFDHNIPDTIPQVDFATKKILAIVTYSNDYYELGIDSVSLYESTLNVEYSCTLEQENMSWTAAIPIIITIDADFIKVRFIENGNQVFEIGI